ncbi:uncharacterized protein LOC122267696 [Penaeus japonicus]|uniref:uncharacterized protein LOC122267696 n=1 Tax=Penaeus japonicus TaxID=27405 RepID=UPI001C717513|nr:uncharacterized protein LOC122267696 [Penaeus japonicus]
MGGWVAAALFCLVVVTTGVQGLTGNQYDLYDHLRSWTCPADEEVWSTGDAVLLSHFADGAWTNEDATCAAPATLTRCSDAAPVPDHSEVKKEYKTTDGSYTFGVFYECASGFAWLSGARGKLTQCKNGKWTTIFDVCTEECPIKSARDCADVHQFGFRETKMYRLTGDEGSYEAHCILDEVPANSGWTFAFRQTEGNDRFHNNVLGSTAYSQHEEGLYDPSSSSYLIGLKKLVAMNRNEDGSRRPLTFLFKITAHDGSKYHASYNGVNIGNASMGYQLEEIGEYHGNAGDSFRKNLGNIFEHYGGAGAFFWAPPSQFDAKEGVYLTFAPIVWETLTDCPDCSAFIPRTVEIYVRPKSWDEATSCPYTNLTHPAWKTVTVDMPISRAPGTNITYTCLGDLMMEGRVGEERTVAGVMHCLNGTDGSLAWDWIPTLPCTFTCPENFTEAPRGGVCYHYSTDDAEFGLVSASLRCSEMGATLAMFTEISDLQNATDDQCYLSSYIKRNDQAVYPWDLNPTLFTCDATEQCQNTDDKNQCYLVCKPDKYRVQDCSIPTPYACMLPAQCPTTYTFYNGLCYKIETFTGSYLDAVYTCNLLGAGLAVPETPEVLNGIGELARVNLPLPAEFLIAVNDREEPGNYNIGGIYSPNEAMVDVLTEARGNLSFSYFTMVEHPEVEVMPTLHTQDSTMTGSFWAVCQFGGPFVLEFSYLLRQPVPQNE